MIRFYQDLYEQPDALRRTANILIEEIGMLTPYAAALRNGTLRRVVLTGMGGSFAAASLPQLMLVQRGITALLVETSELLYEWRALLTEDTLVVAISQSGQTVEIVRLLDEIERLPQRPHVVGITNTPGSALAIRAQAALITQAGPEESVSTKTYTSTLGALVGLARGLGGGMAGLQAALEGVAETMQSWLPLFAQRAQAAAAAVAPEVRFMMFLGRGYARPTANAGALVVKETAKIPTEGVIGGQFRHGPREIMEAGVIPVILMGSGIAYDLNAALVRDLLARDATLITLGGKPVSDLHIDLPMAEENLLPMLDILPIQLFAGALAEARGIVPGSFRYSTKVTTTE